MIILGDRSLSLWDIEEIVYRNVPVTISDDTTEKIAKTYERIKEESRSEKATYGINTGFGALAETKISPNDQEALQRNIILSHAVGVGNYLDFYIAKSLILLRLNTLAQAYSGASPQLIEHLLKLLNANCAPLVPKKGSVGASGDLAPLAHLGLLLLGIGEALVDNERVSAKNALEQARLCPLHLGIRDGLALINGTQAMTAVGLHCLKEATELSHLADLAAACSLDALGGHATPFDTRIHALKPHKGQIETAANMQNLIRGRKVEHRYKNPLTQDPYSLRCVPQVHGASKEVLYHVESILKTEANAVTDNPLFFFNEDLSQFDSLSGGNFHGQHLALALDYLAMGTSELANISERRIELLLNPRHSNGLPPFLINKSGQNSGFMMLHVTASALVNENKVLCHPASTDSIPTSANREDHVSMGMTSANKLMEVLWNTKHVLAIELLAALQALDFRPKNSFGVGVQQIHQHVREFVQFREQDGLFRDDLLSLVEWLDSANTKKLIKNYLLNAALNSKPLKIRGLLMEGFMKAGKIYFFSFLLLFYGSFICGATADCEQDKHNLLLGILYLEMGESLSFALPPDSDHDVIKAIPTHKIGEWLELRFAEGELKQIRKVSPDKTIVLSFDEKCMISEKEVSRTHEHYSGEFSDADLEGLLKTREQGVIYTISPGHPLSELALPGLMDNAEKYHLKLTLLVDPTIAEQDFLRLKNKYPSLQKMESLELIYRGMFNHFPSTLIYKDGHLIGRPMLGARAKEEFDAAFTQLRNEPYPMTPLAELSREKQSPSFGVMAGVDESYKIARTFKLPQGMNVKFARSVPNSELFLLFEARGKRMVHLYDSEKEQVVRTWKNMTTPYVSSDGKFAVMMDLDHHLVFQELDRDEPFFRDSMPAWYPAISVIKEENGVFVYRLITRMMDLKVQDYQIDFNTHPPHVTRLSDEHRICVNFPTNATPYISRFDGDKLTLIQPDNSRQIVKLMADQSCIPLVNLGFWTWKASFSFDDSFISFTAVRVNSMLSGVVSTFRELFVGRSFIYDIENKRLGELDLDIADSFSFPEFRSDGSIMVLRNNEGLIFTNSP